MNEVKTASVKKVDVVVDSGFGSSGKGAVAFWLSRNKDYDTVISINGFQAGHTAIDINGRKWVHLVLPSGVYAKKNMLMAPGSAFYPEQMAKELEGSADLMANLNFMIHECAIVGKSWMAEEEAASADMQSTGSTRKGFGVAQAAKTVRRADVIARDSMELLAQYGLDKYVVTHQQYLQVLKDSKRILLESSQGYSLSLNAGFYPYCTSRDCTTSQTIAAAQIPPQWVDHVYGVSRLYPIRVNNREGSSGPCYKDQEEITFESIGQEPELTTVTKLPRRIFTFSMDQVKESALVNGITDVVLTFADYNIEGAVELIEKINTEMEDEGLPARVTLVTTGPTECDMWYADNFVECDHN
jgi:adenylosuccinate synthase